MKHTLRPVFKMMRPGWRSKPIMWRRFQPIRERAQSIRAKIHLTLANIVNFQKWHRLLEPESIWNYSWQWWKCYFLWIRKNDSFSRRQLDFSEHFLFDFMNFKSYEKTWNWETIRRNSYQEFSFRVIYLRTKTP